VSFVIAILGLAFLILVHECGHFFASLAVGLRPRRFWIGFPPAVAKTTRNGIDGSRSKLSAIDCECAATCFSVSGP